MFCTYLLTPVNISFEGCTSGGVCVPCIYSAHGVSRFGLAVRLVSRGTSVRIRFGSLFSSKAVVCGHCLVSFVPHSYETLKWLSSLPTLMQKSFWRWQCSDSYITSLFSHLRTPFNQSLISLMVSVDIKHHVYLLTYSARPPRVSASDSVSVLCSCDVFPVFIISLC